MARTWTKRRTLDRSLGARRRTSVITVRKASDIEQHDTHLKEVDNHVPLASVADEVGREMRDEPVVDGQVGVLDHELEVVVGLVELIVEEQIRLQPFFVIHLNTSFMVTELT